MARLRSSRAALLALAASLCPLAVHGADRNGEVRALHDAVLSAQGPQKYTAIRALWSAWEHGDPQPVEASLARLAREPRLAPEVRSYAALLQAYGKRRRGDLHGSEAAIRELGYVTDFAVAGPFDNEGKDGFLTGLGPEAADGPSGLGASWPGKERPVRFRPLSALGQGVFGAGYIDLSSLLRPEEQACAFAFTAVREEQPSGKPRPLTLWLGQGGAVRVYWNGREVARDESYRALDPDRIGVDVTLQPGENQLLLKLCGAEAAPAFALRVADRDGKPSRGLVFRGGAGPIEAVEQGPLEARFAQRGPLASFQAQLGKDGKGGTPAQWEAYARYLRRTSSDDLSAHTARDYAARAAERAPSTARSLLAAELAEDSNQQRRWIERAEKGLDRRREADVTALLHAKARLLRDGINPRDATAIYDELLQRNPDDDEALIARVELYAEAGLPETALHTLRQALARNPHNVLLLRAATLLLRDQARGAEAVDAMNAYATLRFDDPTVVRVNLARALAQRHRDEATRLAARLVATAPDNAALLGEAAEAHVSLGDMATAVAYAKRATELLPEDADTLKRLADLYGRMGRSREQVALYQQIAVLKPQDKTIRDYLAQQKPDAARDDEAMARPASEFLAKRGEAANGQAQRTLSDLKVTTVYANGLASRFRQVVLQPLTAAAAAAARQYAFGYQADSEVVELRGARIHRKDGSVVEATETGDVATDDPSMAMYTSQRAFLVNFPRIDPGDVIEVRYRVEDVAHRNAFADYFGEVTYFGGNEPVGRQEYVLITPKSRSFQFNQPNVRGLNKTTEERGEQRLHRFVASSLPPSQREPLQPPPTEQLGYVHVSTYKSWDDMGKWYWGLVRDQFAADDEVRRRASEITRGLTTTEDKVRAVYKYVVQNTRYVALEFGIHGYKPYRCAQIFARGFGDCKDKATLIVSMLRELGIPATFVIVRTQMRGDFATEPASLAPFDHAIAYVPSLDLYLDGTAEDTGSRELPSMDRGALALQINEGKPKLVRLPDPPASESVLRRSFQVDLSGKAPTVQMSADVSGVHASSWRRRYRNESARADRLKEDVGGELNGFNPSQLRVSDLTDIERPVHLEASGGMSSPLRAGLSSVSIPVGPRASLVRDYAPLSQRTHDVKISARTSQITEWELKLPSGASASRLPSSGKVETPFGRVEVQVSQEGQSVRVRSEIRLDVSRVKVADYAAFRAFCEQGDQLLGARLTVQTGARP